MLFRERLLSDFTDYEASGFEQTLLLERLQLNNESLCFCNMHVFWVFFASSSFMFLLLSPFLPPLRLSMDFLTLCPLARQQLKTVGVALSLRMTEHSSDLWLGFGSFVDKPVSPYINVHPSKINNPCR